MNVSLEANGFIDEILKLTELQEMKVAMKNNVLAGFFVGVTTLCGGLFFGPLGIAIGSTFGGCTASYVLRGTFKSVPQIIKEDLTPEQRKKLAASVQELCSTHNIQTALQLALYLKDDKALLLMVIQLIKTFLESELAVKTIESCTLPSSKA
ncbi:protein C19orf12 homolog [Cephus cinctus]|uniref:Protein C19orf12 homolog n=1 Tax=Cephus cinctus TaxID=211228 RepID=A0AAJ7BZG5_CEPCN|nr:protein C19orf12 homolog [Cephus cinctus]